MDLNSLFLEANEIVQAFAPVDLSAAAVAGDWVDISESESLVVVFVSAAGTAGDDPVISLDQASDASGTGTKALNFTKLWHKVGATALSGVGQWTEVTQTASDSYDTDGIDGAENECMLAIEIKPSDLDVDNGFKYVQLDVADVGTNAQLGYGFYVLKNRKYKRDVGSNSSLID